MRTILLCTIEHYVLIRLKVFTGPREEALVFWRQPWGIHTLEISLSLLIWKTFFRAIEMSELTVFPLYNFWCELYRLSQFL
ncbi:hypothetical protein FKM82_010333 [Ascaphus truei]